MNQRKWDSAVTFEAYGTILDENIRRRTRRMTQDEDEIYQEREELLPRDEGEALTPRQDVLLMLTRVLIAFVNAERATSPAQRAHYRKEKVCAATMLGRRLYELLGD